VVPAAITTSRRALALGVVGILSALALSATPSAIAAGGCPGSLKTPFLSWADSNQYWLAPEGNFQGKSTWALTGGAAIANGNETFYVGNKNDSYSLSIPAGGSATTPSVCITALSPLMRFFATGGNPTSPLKVEVIATTPVGTMQRTIASVGASANWAPTPQIYFLAGLAALANPDGTMSVKFRFSNPGTAAWKIDDVYVDPWKLK
jgi:hypothetical protein